MESEQRHTSGGRERPAAPEQPDDGFEEGLEQRPDTPEEQLEPDFARGLAAEEPTEEPKPRFSRGEEEFPGSPENEAERRFSEGLERGTGDD
jgi:hypothetical protein